MAFADRQRDEALTWQYGMANSSEAWQDFPEGARLRVSEALARALLNGLMPYEHTLMCKCGCLKCSCVPVAEAGDGDLNRLIQAFGADTVRSQEDLPPADSTFVSVGDDVSQLLIKCADFEAQAQARVAALSTYHSGQPQGSFEAASEQSFLRAEAAHRVLLEGGLSHSVAAAASSCSLRTQRARITASKAWAGAHPGGDLAWELKYLLGFLEMVYVHHFGGLSRAVRAIYQLRQTPPVVLNATRATEFRMAGNFASGLFGPKGRKDQKLAADEDVLAFTSWTMEECVGLGSRSGHDGSEAEPKWSELDVDMQKAITRKYRSHLGPNRQALADKIELLSRPELVNYVETMQRKCIEGRQGCHEEQSPLMQMVAQAASSLKIIDHGELTWRCVCRPIKEGERAVKGKGSARTVSMRLSDGMESLNHYTDSLGGFRRGMPLITITDIACKLAVSLLRLEQAILEPY